MGVLTRLGRRGLVAVAAVSLLAAGCGDDDDDAADDETTTTEEGAAEVPEGIVIGAGINDPEDVNIAVLEFLPEAVSVEVGEAVTWEWNGPEPHSVTFLEPGQELPPPGSDPALFEPTPPTGPYDGSTFVNSGLQPLGPDAPAPFEMTFAAAGEYPYFCVIHPLMTGALTVVEAGGEVDTPEDVADRAADERDQWLEDGRAAKAALVEAEPASTTNDDGSTTWTVEMGATTEHVDVLAFAPTPAEAAAGDTVTFVNNSGAPHTASFFGEGADPITSPLDPRTDAPAPGPSPQTLSAAGFFNTGLLPPNAPPDAAPPEAVRSFSFVIPEAGTYSYVCILHAPSQMVGVLEVT
jgi:plastocyanin